MLQFRQPQIRTAGFLNEASQLPCAVTGCANKGGHLGCIPKQNGFDIFFSFMDLNENNGFKSVFN